MAPASHEPGVRTGQIPVVHPSAGPTPTQIPDLSGHGLPDSAGAGPDGADVDGVGQDDARPDRAANDLEVH
jgi:two-component system sensor histidine kinase MtrB